ncbi:hypothetical protein BJ170DRAFT_720002 [Xylariales sp. AK1849]|nr:hypothetical protein BJ170DRAFT_720002 [Xylariales sp. AK1849]
MDATSTSLQGITERYKSRNQLKSHFNGFLSEYTPDVEDIEVRNRCIVCDKPGKDRCGKCNEARYCSRECQVKDWSYHKVLCKNFSSFTDSRRPSADHVRGILFSAAERLPKLVWLEQKVRNGETTVMVDQYFSKYSASLGTLTINLILENAGYGDLGHGLITISEATEPEEGFPINKSIMALGKAGHMCAWFGNHLIVATKPDPSTDISTSTAHKEKNEGRSSKIEKEKKDDKNVMLDDINFRDSRHAIDMFQVWHLNPGISNPERHTNPNIPALMIHCDASYMRFAAFGLQDRLDRIKMPLHIQSSAQQHVEQEHATGPHKVGLEWFIRRYPAEKEWTEVSINPTTLRNDSAKNLIPTHALYHSRRNIRQLNMKPDTHEDIAKPHTGTVLLFDRHGGIIQPVHLEAFNDFMKSVEKYQPTVTYDTNDYTEMEDVQAPLWVGPDIYGIDNAKRAFNEFWEDWKRKKEVGGSRLGNIPSPYKLSVQVDDQVVHVETIMNKLYREAI